MCVALHINHSVLSIFTTIYLFFFVLPKNISPLWSRVRNRTELNFAMETLRTKSLFKSITTGPLGKSLKNKCGACSVVWLLVCFKGLVEHKGCRFSITECSERSVRVDTNSVWYGCRVAVGCAGGRWGWNPVSATTCPCSSYWFSIYITLLVQLCSVIILITPLMVVTNNTFWVLTKRSSWRLLLFVSPHSSGPSLFRPPSEYKYQI